MAISSIGGKIKKSDIINLAAVSLVTIICGVFLAIALNSYNSSASGINIYNLKQVASTDSSLLLSWECSANDVEKYFITYDIDGEKSTIYSDIPFARIGDLKPASNITASVYASSSQGVSSPVSINCSTKPRCNVTTVNSFYEDNALKVSWEFNGTDNGFSVLAYVIDSNGFRHFTTNETSIEPKQSSECRLEGILPCMSYTVAVIPKTEYKKIGKLTVEPVKYYSTFDKLKILQSVVCDESSANTQTPKKLTSISQASSYYVTLILNGKSEQTSSDITLCFLNELGTLQSEKKYTNVNTAAVNKPSYAYRPIPLEFTADMPLGTYNVLVLIDGKPAAKLKVTVAESK